MIKRKQIFDLWTYSSDMRSSLKRQVLVPVADYIFGKLWNREINIIQNQLELQVKWYIIEENQ